MKQKFSQKRKSKIRNRRNKMKISALDNYLDNYIHKISPSNEIYQKQIKYRYIVIILIYYAVFCISNRNSNVIK